LGKNAACAGAAVIRKRAVRNPAVRAILTIAIFASAFDEAI
jgi:hypothetical protein